MRARHPILALFLVLAVVPTTLSAQSAQERALEVLAQQMSNWQSVLEGNDFEVVGETMSGGAAQGDSDDHAIRLEAGVDYRMVAACDQDCSDVDLFLLDPDGEVVDSDVATDDSPIVEFRPSTSGDFTLRVQIVSCSVEPCLHAAALYRYAPAADGTGSAGAAGATTVLIDETGVLAEGDETLAAGEFVDRFEINATAGQTLVATMESSEFDTYLLARGPGDFGVDNDDDGGSSARSRIEERIPETGAIVVSATSFEPNETGTYRITIALRDGGGSAASSAGDASRTESGELRPGDATLTSGEFYDTYTFQGTAGDQVVVDLRSEELDPYLMLIAPSDERESNDDFEGSARRSVISSTLAETGEYRVIATSYAPEEVGSYVLTIDHGASTDGVRNERGALEDGDETINSGEYADVYRIQGSPGQQLRASVSSSDFDTYLMVVGPDSDRKENDDLENRPGESEVEMTLAESGEYRVVVTSYQPGETGSYELTIDQRASGRTAQRGRDVSELQDGTPVAGALEETDTQLDGGEYRDMYVFEGTAGERVSVAMQSQSFDTYVGLITPSGDQIDNDDWEGSTSESRVDYVLPETGRYRVMATSYQADEVGPYRVVFERDAGAAVASTGMGEGPANVYGVFVGVSDYGGRANDLAFTAEDAERVSTALQTSGAMRAENAIVLTDSDATRANVERAVREVGSRAGPDDMFVFFYSGHGAQVPRPAPQATDPDALDETLEFYDTRITDDEFAALLNEIAPGMALIALDACYSGGFSKDVVSVPGRMGLFSSEEDVVSAVASKFRAGGYLAHFFADGVGQRLADLNGDRTTSALEFSQYLHNRYREDVESSSGSDYVRTSGPQLGYQHLVVDRGSVGSATVLFRN